MTYECDDDIRKRETEEAKKARIEQLITKYLIANFKDTYKDGRREISSLPWTLQRETYWVRLVRAIKGGQIVPVEDADLASPHLHIDLYCDVKQLRFGYYFGSTEDATMGMVTAKEDLGKALQLNPRYIRQNIVEKQKEQESRPKANMLTSLDDALTAGW